MTPVCRFPFCPAIRKDACATSQRGWALRRFQGDATPKDKLETVALLQCAGQRIAMVGDGINDAPVMARADVGIAVGEGAELTRSQADVVLLSGSLVDLGWAIETARRAVRIVWQNVAWAVAYNAVCVPVALVGWLPPWAAGLGMAASSAVVVVNALRLEGAPHFPSNGRAAS